MLIHISETKVLNMSFLAKQLLPPIFFKAAKKLFRRKSKIEYRYGDFSILLPFDHLLPEYQKNFAKYDRFLPHLVQHLSSDATIVDIGANVGDTLAGMVEKNPYSTFVCIEPDSEFYGYLVDNIDRIKRIRPQLNVLAVQTLVGKTVSGVSLVGVGGTKHAVINDQGGIKSRLLDEILAELPGVSNVRLLKSDVDGFDYDVIDSSFSIINRYGPMVFLECFCEFDYQKEGYKKTLSSLEKCGYIDWTVFDNFGEVVLRTSDVGIVFQLIEYAWAQRNKRTTQKIYYFDILASLENDKDLIGTALSSYV